VLDFIAPDRAQHRSVSRAATCHRRPGEARV